MSEIFDVVVVGAGPSGSTTAWALARAGVRVLLVDGSEFPRSKPCGEAISPGATPLLEEMGVLPRLRRDGAAEIGAWRLRMPDGRFVSSGFARAEASDGRQGVGAAPSAGLSLSRRRLDAALLHAALAAGARFHAPLRVYDVDAPGASALAGDGPSNDASSAGPAAHVRLTARDAAGRRVRLRATCIVGADGLRSVVARRVFGVRRGRRDRLALVGRYVPSLDSSSGPSPGSAAGLSPDTGEMRLSAEGCLGAAPIEDGLWTVNVVVPRRLAPEISADPFGFYRARIERYGFPAPPSEAALAGGLEITGPFEVAPRAVTAPGVLLTGDAAGYFDPLTGQGIYRALVTGRHAATAVRAALESPGCAGEARRTYADALTGCLTGGRRVQKLVDAVVRRPALANPAGRLLTHRPGLLSLLLDVTGDRVPPRELLNPAAVATALRRR